jgi:hypothetical protein
MFVVIPVLVIVYGGCACIYCCYKCRRYIKENKPFQELADRIRGRETEENEDSNEDVDESTQGGSPDEESRPETTSGCRNLHSNHSSPGPEGAVRYVDYDTDLRSAMSTPGMLYKRDYSVKLKRQKRTPSAVAHNESDSEMRSDSGILEDSALTHLSDSQSARNKMSAEASLVIEEIDHPVEESKGMSSYAARNPSAPYVYLAQRVSTCEIAIQTDDFEFQRNNTVSVQSKPPRSNVVAKYMNWRKNRKDTEKDQNIVKKDSKRKISKSDTKNSFSSDSGISIISDNRITDKRTKFGVNSDETFNNRNSSPSSRFRSQPFKKTKAQESATNMDLKEFIVGPWK